MTPSPPASIEKELKALRVAVKYAIPEKAANNLLIASWNLRAFSDLTEQWTSGPKDSPKRDWHSVAAIAAIVVQFDVVAVQEIRRDLSALRFLLEQLGAGWRFITSDVTEGHGGNGERLAFLYDSTRVEPSGLVGELVLPPKSGDPTKQFARTPYAASFRRKEVDFILTTVHIVWANRAIRLPEIENFAVWMRGWVDRRNDWNKNLLVLGDFNLDRLGNPLYEAFVSTGLYPPAELDKIPRTIFDNDKTQHFYDQIAWFSTPTGDSMLDGLTYALKAGTFDFIPHVLPGMTKLEISWRISDHYPLWVEFEL